MGFQDIPIELRNQNSWVSAWDGTKCPMQSTRRKAARICDPATWSTYSEAIESVEKGLYDYPGYVFHDTDIVGIDVDQGFEDGILTDLGLDILLACKSYTELSKSGRGYHIFVRGVLPFEGRNNGSGVEMYRTKRYFIMTGVQYHFTNLISNQNAIDYIVNKYMNRFSLPLGASERYTGIYQPASENSIPIQPVYPPIGEGGRNMSLTSLAGSLKAVGYSEEQLLDELRKANREACKPPLSDSEVRSICRSIGRYRR